jgi:hypothetical protein
LKGKLLAKLIAKRQTANLRSSSRTNKPEIPRQLIMAKLNSATRNALPASEFGMPKQRKYPMPDVTHAVNAEARATQMVNKGKLSPATAARIRAKAKAILSR